MGTIDYSRFQRMLLRSAEVAAEAGMKVSVVRVHNETLKPAADAFLAAHEAVRKAETAFRKENKEAVDALAMIDVPYKEARSVVRAFAPETVLPVALRSQPTDTDKLDAIEKLIHTLGDHGSQPWAIEIAQGEVGQRAAVTVKELNEAIAANKGLAQARVARAAAYEPAYERYLRFKRVVRDALGSRSRQYKRIHLRAPGSAPAEDAPETRAEPGMVWLPVEAMPSPSQQALGPVSSRMSEAQPQ